MSMPRRDFYCGHWEVLVPTIIRWHKQGSSPRQISSRFIALMRINSLPQMYWHKCYRRAPNPGIIDYILYIELGDKKKDGNPKHWKRFLKINRAIVTDIYLGLSRKFVAKKYGLTDTRIDQIYKTWSGR